MKTWEMMKVLMENNKLKARSMVNGNERVVSVGKSGLGNVCIISEQGVAVLPIDADWELIPQEVTWQEAIQSWIDGKSLTIELGKDSIAGESKYFQPEINRLGCFICGKRGFDKELFIKGKWYIK
jgi:hypothetical protein